MSNDKTNSGPAFPAIVDDVRDVTAYQDAGLLGFSKREYAAIKLRVPDSGVEWLDEMIKRSLRDEFAGRAMAMDRVLAAISDKDSAAAMRLVPELALSIAEALLKAREQ